jgi:hypothetical protein
MALAIVSKKYERTKSLAIRRAGVALPSPEASAAAAKKIGFSPSYLTLPLIRTCDLLCLKSS